jgi:hypothetical protein
MVAGQASGEEDREIGGEFIDCEGQTPPSISHNLSSRGLEVRFSFSSPPWVSADRAGIRSRVGDPAFYFEGRP